MTKPAAPPRPRRLPPRPPRRAKSTLIYDTLEKAQADAGSKPKMSSMPPAPPKRKARKAPAAKSPAAPKRKSSAPPPPRRPASKAPAQPLPARPAAARPTAARPAPAKRAPVKKAPAKTAPAKKAPAQQAKRAPAVQKAPAQQAKQAPAVPAANPSVTGSRDPSRTLASEMVAVAARESGNTTARTRAKRSRDLKPGDLVAERYQVTAIISRARGLLLDATHTGFDQRVAVRVLNPGLVNDKAVEHFNREARILSRLESEHVARIVDFGRMPDGALYLAREYVRGKSLSSYAAAKGGLPVEQAVLHLLQVAEAVQEAHTEGVVLRDMQPGHVFLADKRNGAPIAKLTDFGTCKVVKDTSAGGELSCTRLLGLSSSASPELVRQSKTITERADVWSLGCLLYELLTGRPAFSGEGVQLALAITRDNPTAVTKLRPELPAHLDQVLAWALAKDPERRFNDVYAFAHELRRFACRRGRLLIEEIGRLATGRAVAPVEPEVEDDSSMAMVCNIQPEKTALVPAAAVLAQLPVIPPPAAVPDLNRQPQTAQHHAAYQAAQRPSSPAAAQHQPSVHPSAPPAAQHQPSVHPSMHPSAPPAAHSQPRASIVPGTSVELLPADAAQPMDPWMATSKPRRGRLAWLVALPAAALFALAVSFSASAPAAASADSGGLHAAATAASAIDTSAYQTPAPTAPAEQADAKAADADAAADSEAAQAEQDKAPSKAAAHAQRAHGARYSNSYRRPQRGGQFLRALANQKQDSKRGVSSSKRGGRGTLVAMAVGSSCNFSVDGKGRGTSSSIRVSVPAGRHTVTCRSSNGTNRSRSLKVSAGKASVTVFKF